MFAILRSVNRFMLKPRGLFSISAVLVFIITGLYGSEKTKKLIEEINKFEKSKDKYFLYKTAEDLIKSDALETNKEDLNDFFYIFRKASFYFPDRIDFAEKLKILFDKKEAQKLLSEDDKSIVLRSFVEARMFEEAKSFSLKYFLDDYYIPDKVPIKQKSEVKGRVLYFSDDKKELKIKKVNLKKYKLAVIFSPTCGATENALTYLLKDETSRMAIRNNSIFLTRRYLPKELFDFAEKFKLKNIYIVYKSKDFEGLYFYSYPIFYFIKDGKIVDEIRGFSSDNDGKPFIDRFLKSFEKVR